MNNLRKIFVLGGKGFVGSAFLRAAQKKGLAAECVDLDDYASFRGKECDLLVNADGNSRKYLAAEKPLEEFELSVVSVLQALHDFRFRGYLHVSTIDVYPDHENPENNREEAPIDGDRLSPYGLHKYLGELLVRRYAPRRLIVRLGGVLGPGLKKNPVFDLINARPLRVHEDSRYQYLPVDFAAQSALELAGKGIWGETVNLCGTGTVTIREIREMLKKPLRYASPSVPREAYEINNEKLVGYCAVPRTIDTIKNYLSLQARGRPAEASFL
jgi:nucleoside-diphosphate-sugar epimerase